MTTWTEIDNRLLDPQWYTTQEYHSVFKQLRDEDPLHWAQDESYGRHYWTLTRYSDVKEYLANDRDFSSRWDTRVPRSPVRRSAEEMHAQMLDVSIAVADNPMHDVLRRPVNKHFSAPAVNRMTRNVEAIVTEILDDVADRGEADFVEEMAADLPLRVICRWLGVPEEDWPLMREASWQWLAAADPKFTIDGDEVATSLFGLKRLTDYCGELVQRRRRDPQDDFLTVLAEARIDGRQLSDHELKGWLVSIIGAGLETTRNAAAVGTYLFLKNPEQQALLVDDPSLVNGAIEEVLRWSTPAKNRLRIATRDIEMHDKTIKRDDWVVAFLASANKDEREFADPHRFDIRRTPNRHLALGEGIHLCLGRNLARLELAVFFTQLLQRFPDLELAAEPAWIADRSVTGFTSMPVTFTPHRVQKAG